MKLLRLKFFGDCSFQFFCKSRTRPKSVLISHEPCIRTNWLDVSRIYYEDYISS